MPEAVDSWEGRAQQHLEYYLQSRIGTVTGVCMHSKQYNKWDIQR